MGKILLGAAAYLLAMALLSKGPLGAIRVLGPRLHQALDLVLVAVLALSPIVARSDLDVAGVIVAEALAIVLLRLAFRTRYVPAPVPQATVVAAATAGGSEVPAGSAEGGHGAPRRAARPPANNADEGHTVAAADDGEQHEHASPGTGHEAPAETAAQPERHHPVPSTAWTLGVLTARARRRGAASDRLLGDGARRLGSALGRANRRRSD